MDVIDQMPSNDVHHLYFQFLNGAGGDKRGKSKIGLFDPEKPPPILVVADVINNLILVGLVEEIVFHQCSLLFLHLALIQRIVGVQQSGKVV